ncbi:MAG: hypothetical protein M3Y64_00835 [Gemmatimonadota bacterium]|nr:hypothetical protein [Gemmatimonadota bacterium]
MSSRFRYGMLAAVAIAASGVTRASLQAQSLAVNGQDISGISCDAQEGQRLHIHQHLLILDHGKPVAIPQNVGQPAARRCIYWLHTHTPDGIVHIEAPLDRKFTLGDFFAIWGQPLSRTRAATAMAGKGASLTVWVNGKKYTGDPRKIDMVAHADIVIQAGPPFGKPPAFTAWGTL